MEESESISTAINAIFTRFDPLPGIVYYDNACNLAKSISLRFPWMFKESTFVCDRFHYTGHKCSGLFDPDTQQKCDGVPTSGAEAINKQWRTSRKHIRFSSADNLIPFLHVRMFFLNIRAHLRDASNGADVENKDIISFAEKIMPCKCARCESLADS